MESLPHKFLDLPVINSFESWPIDDGFRYLGHALRIDYSTQIHTDDGEWESYYHHFTNGVKVYEPAFAEHDYFAISTRDGMMENRDQLYPLPPSVDPIVFGIVDRFVFMTPENKILAAVHPDVGLSPEDMNEELYFVSELPDAALAWDPEGQQLLILDLFSHPLFVLQGSTLKISESGMIVG